MFTTKLSKNLIFTLLFTSLFTIISCKDDLKKTTETQIDKVKDDKEPSESISAETILNELEQLDGLIEIDTARKWQQTYTKSISEEYIQSLDYEFNSEFTIPLERLKKYIEYYESYAEIEKLENPGFRVYLSVRPPNKKNYEKRSVETIFITPTATNAKEIQGAKSLIEQHGNVTTFKIMNLFGSGNKPL